jgi:hypothetical protein
MMHSPVLAPYAFGLLFLCESDYGLGSNPRALPASLTPVQHRVLHPVRMASSLPPQGSPKSGQ